jgi:hypothetical protein
MASLIALMRNMNAGFKRRTHAPGHVQIASSLLSSPHHRAAVLQREHASVWQRHRQKNQMS